METNCPTDIKCDLFYHQQLALSKASTSDACLFIRLPGTGKTLIQICIIKYLLKLSCDNILWIGPAHLISHYKSYLRSHDIPYVNNFLTFHRQPQNKVMLCSYDYMRLHKKFFLSQKIKNIIVDEIHHAKNPKTKTSNVLMQLRKNAIRLYAFTGTPFQNTPYEFFEQLNIVSGKQISKSCEQQLKYARPQKKSIVRIVFEKLNIPVSRVNQGPIIGIQNPERLIQLLAPYVDYLPPEKYLAECKIPFVEEHIEYVPMSENEVLRHLKISSKLRRKMDKAFINDDLPDEETDKTFNRLVVLRQMLLEENSTKISKCVNDIHHLLKDTFECKVLVFTNFVKTGIENTKSKLENLDIKFQVYTGNLSSSKKKNVVSTFMNGDSRVLLLSPVGFEGLDLLGVTHIFVLDPHFNPERKLQLISRAIRAYSGVNKIQIKYYISHSEKVQRTVDEAILKIASRKSKLNAVLENCLKRA